MPCSSINSHNFGRKTTSAKQRIRKQKCKERQSHPYMEYRCKVTPIGCQSAVKGSPIKRKGSPIKRKGKGRQTKTLVCKDTFDTTKRYTGKEPSPKGLGYCAGNRRVGEVRNGKNGKQWIVSQTKSGTRRWVRYSTKINNATTFQLTPRATTFQLTPLHKINSINQLLHSYNAQNSTLKPATKFKTAWFNM